MLSYCLSPPCQVINFAVLSYLPLPPCQVINFAVLSYLPLPGHQLGRAELPASPPPARSSTRPC